MKIYKRESGGRKIVLPNVVSVKTGCITTFNIDTQEQLDSLKELHKNGSRSAGNLVDMLRTPMSEEQLATTFYGMGKSGLFPNLPL